MSSQSAHNPAKMLIEVKSSTRDIEFAEAIISRHEWDVAAMKNNVDRYRFYFWLIDPVASSHKLATISVEEMNAIIPIDKYPGHWESVAIPYTAFSDKFEVLTVQ